MLTYNLDEVDAGGGQSDERQARPPRAARPLVRRLLAVGSLAAIFFGVLLVRSWGADSNGTTPKQVVTGSAVMPTSPAIEEQYGIRFLGVDITSGGGMIQLRYQVLDSAKTESIHDETAAPYVIDSSGHKFADPGLVGHTHIGPAKASGTTDFVLIANSGGKVKPGEFVTIKIGDLEMKHVPVV